LLLRVYGDRNLVTGWAFTNPQEFVTGDVRATMARLATQGGGQLEEAPSAAFAHTLRGYARGQPLAPFLVLFVTLLWPVDIAVRRLALSRADVERFVARSWAWLRRARVKRSARDGAPAPQPTLASALRRRQQRDAQPSALLREQAEEQASPASSAVASLVHPSQKDVSTARVEIAEQPAADDEAEAETLAARLKRRVKDS
jgi:hypothetical protein